MEEYQQIMSNYEKQRKQNRNIIILSLFLIIITSAIIKTDKIRFDPFLMFICLMVLVLFYAYKGRLTSQNYDNLYNFLRKNNKTYFKNKEFVFYADYQLNQSYQDNPKELKALIKNKTNRQKLNKKLSDIHFIFDSFSNDKIPPVDLSKQPRKKKVKKRKTELTK